MTERNGMRYGVLGLIVLTLLIFLGLMVAMQSTSTSTPAAPSAATTPAGQPPKAPRCRLWPPRNCRCSTCA